MQTYFYAYYYSFPFIAHVLVKFVLSLLKLVLSNRESMSGCVVSEIYKPEPRREVVCLIQHGRECFIQGVSKKTEQI
jgi:hypothetical protein